MNLSDPELELVDPTPNVHSLFLHFDQVFFWTKLASRAVVRWSKRMYSCAGICSYDRGGLCDIALSEPLLKLRPRKDLIETLLHEMIHAYLFVTHRDQDRDGHGPNFKQHMYRINKAAGLNISIYHDFHDEVELYKTHWWRCNGPCHTMKPHFGIVRRSANRAPGPSDYWWKGHQKRCGGNFVKIKEPENYGKDKKKRASPKPSGDITKYISTTSNNNNNDIVIKPVLKDSNNVPVKSNLITKSNSSNTIVVTKRNNIIYNPKVTNSNVIVFSGKGQPINSSSKTRAVDVAETVRSVWANKQLTPSTAQNTTTNKVPRKTIVTANTSKHKADTDILSPPSKIKKIDDYFKTTATSLLKDLYGKDFEIKETNTNKRFSVVAVDTSLVNCPVCNNEINSEKINRHLDECLNKDIIESIKDDEVNPLIHIKSESNNLKGYGNTQISLKNIEQTSANIKKENDHILLGKIKTEIGAEQNQWNENKCIKNENLIKTEVPQIKIEPGLSSSTDTIITINDQKCPCCGKIVCISINEHLEECLAFFNNNTTMPTEGTSTSFADNTIVINDDDDIFDESLTLNATGTKSPCPCCLKMIEQNDMNDHLDLCLS